MRSNPILRDMDIQDLNQRYRQSWIHYNGKVEFCQGFTQRAVEGKPAKPKIQLSRPDGLYLTIFDSDKLNVLRPAPQWLKVTGLASEPIPVFFAYKLCRQWVRGFTEANTAVFSPLYRVNLNHPHILTELFDRPTPKETPIRLDDLLTVVKKDKFKILSPSLACITIKQTPTVYFRQTPVATISKDGLALLVPHFEQEINEQITR